MLYFKCQKDKEGDYKSNPFEGTDFINTDNYANKQLDFYYFIPSEVLKDRKKAYPALICVPGLSEKCKDFVNPEFKKFAENEGFIIIAPSFVWDNKNWEQRTSYQYPEAWSGNALLSIIEKFSKKTEIQLSKLYLYGFSAGAQFCLRFAIWKPDLCIAVAAHGSGGTIILNQKIDVRFFVSIGKGDAERIEKVESFYWRAKELGVEVIYRQYEGGHILPLEQINDSLKFFKQVMAK